jgi:hypothetical protein
MKSSGGMLKEMNYVGSHAKVCVCYAESLTLVLQMNTEK